MPEIVDLPDSHPGPDRVLPLEGRPLAHRRCVDGFCLVELPLFLPDLGLVGVAVGLIARSAA